MMTISPISKIREAYGRAIGCGDSHESACRVVARLLGIPVETVAEAVTEVAA